MRLNWGEPPAAPDFEPEVEGFVPMREPSASVVSYAGSAGGLVLAAIVAVVIRPVLAPAGVDIVGAALAAKPSVALPFLAGMFGILLLVIPVHELIHYLCYPSGSARGIGMWPRKLLFYAYTTDPAARGRLLPNPLVHRCLLRI